MAADSLVDISEQWESLKYKVQDSGVDDDIKQEMKALLEKCRVMGRKYPFLEERKCLQAIASEIAETLMWEGGEDHPEALILSADEPLLRVEKSGIPRKKTGISKIDINNLVQAGLSPLSGSGRILYGREKELQELDGAWSDSATKVLIIRAIGGAGKSALVNYWLNDLKRRDYLIGDRQIEYIFGWSFMSGGTGDHRLEGADRFIRKAFEFFYDEQPERLDSQSLPKLGEQLAQVVAKKEAILILDGLEPLQFPPSPTRRVQAGEINHPAIMALIKELANTNNGLCIITTRLPVTNLKNIEPPNVREILLTNLSPPAGTSLLRSFGLSGNQKHFEEASRAADGHGLTLTIMGAYLQASEHKNIRRWNEIPLLKKNQFADRAKTMIEYYDRFLGDGRKLSAAWSLIRILGIFDRPASLDAIKAVLKKPAIKGLTEPLTENMQSLSEAIRQLQDSGLLLEGTSDSSDRPENTTYDIHPLLREYYSDKLCRDKAVWQETHKRLYNFFKAFKPEQPKTLEEMIPLYQAVFHGCESGLYQEVFDEVLILRIHQDQTAPYSWYTLAAFGEELAALSHFYKRLWTKPVESLSEQAKAYLQNAVGYCLRALGRLKEAEKPLKLGRDLYTEQERWKEAAVTTGILTEKFLLSGSLGQALDSAKLRLKIANSADDQSQIISAKSMLADIFHQQGNFKEAAQSFHEAEEIQAAFEPDFPLLYAMSGYLYCDFLLSQGEVLSTGKVAPDDIGWNEGNAGILSNEVESDNSIDIDFNQLSLKRFERLVARLELTLEFLSKESSPPLDIGLNKLALGKTHLSRVIYTQQSSYLSEADKHLSEAVSALRTAGQQQELPRGLLALAALRRVQERISETASCLDELMVISSQGSMKRYMADGYIEYTRLYITVGDFVSAKKSFDAANSLVKDTGYRRRELELEILSEKINEMRREGSIEH